MLRVAPKSDVAVLLVCFGLTVTFDMVVGVSVGMVLAALLFMRRMAEVTEARLTEAGHPDLPGPLPDGVIVYEISGPLFFGAAQTAMSTLGIVAGQTRAVILLMDEVRAMDATGLVALESALEPLRRHGCLAILTGVRPQPMTLLDRADLTRRASVVLCKNAAEALDAARKHVGVSRVSDTPAVPPTLTIVEGVR
jgi:SulP family sulfate permease